jgi:hypothetical protein
LNRGEQPAEFRRETADAEVLIDAAFQLNKCIAMNLLLKALLVAVEQAADGRGLEKFRVAWKFNAADELVVAVIVRDSRLTKDRLDPTPNGYRPPKPPR